MAAVVRDMERLASEAGRQLAPAAALPSGVQSRGAEPSAVQTLEFVQDMW
jgi:hypothetical protein